MLKKGMECHYVYNDSICLSVPLERWFIGRRSIKSIPAVPEFLLTQFSRKHDQNARFQSLKTSVLGLFSRTMGLYIRALETKGRDLRRKN